MFITYWYAYSDRGESEKLLLSMYRRRGFDSQLMLRLSHLHTRTILCTQVAPLQLECFPRIFTTRTIASPTWISYKLGPALPSKDPALALFPCYSTGHEAYICCHYGVPGAHREYVEFWAFACYHSTVFWRQASQWPSPSAKRTRLPLEGFRVSRTMPGKHALNGW